MTKEKQIEEMSADIQKAVNGCSSYWSGLIADKLYTAGYRKQSEWISVGERLPEDTIPDDYKYKTIKVLVAIKGKNGVTIRTQERFLDCTYRDDKRTAFWTWRFSAGNVTHWMPLPEAPKKGGEE